MGKQIFSRLTNVISDLKTKDHKPVFGALDILKYIGPGLLVTVGFTDPGNWAANIATGSGFGYSLLWVISLSTIMLIILQHNVAHLGIATGLCLSEAATIYLRPSVSKSILSFAVLASVSTSVAEIIGGAIALNMLFDVPIRSGSILVTAFALIMLFSNSYQKIEKWIIAFVSIIGLSFLYELLLIKVDWVEAGISWVKPSFPEGSILLIMSVLGAVIMPHNLFLHSEIIQSRQWNLESEKLIKKQLRYEFVDTLFSMILGWAINCAIILLAAETFFSSRLQVNDLTQAHNLLHPLLGDNSANIFAVALLFAGAASAVTSGIAAGSIFSGMFSEPYNLKDTHTRTGIGISLLAAFFIVLLVQNPYKGLILSQMLLSIQLPFNIFLQIYLTSSKKVMGTYANTAFTKIVLWIIAIVVTLLNIMLFISAF